jgi:FkbM family methyltransferase
VNKVNITAIMGVVPAALRRHLVVDLLLGVFPDSHDQWIEFNEGARAYVDLRDPEARNVFLKRSFEPDFFKLASAVLSEGGVFFDCGANFGLCTFGLLPSIASSHLSCHLFEANPTLIRYLERTRSLFPSTEIRVTEGCVSDQHGISHFHINTESPAQSHVAANGATVRPNVVLDDYLERNGLNAVTLLKMDLEGQELNALRGLAKALDRGAVEVIYFEARSELFHRYGLTPEDIIQFLNEKGFRVFYCRDRDLNGTPRTTSRFTRSGLNQLQLSEFESPSGDLGTDLLAIRQTLIVKAAV